MWRDVTVRTLSNLSNSSTSHPNMAAITSGLIVAASTKALAQSLRNQFDQCSIADTTCVSDLWGDPWFTRGWTLQEFLAPKRIKLFGKSWQHITLDSVNNNKDPDLKVVWQVISSITRIPLCTLLNFTPGIDYARDALVWVSKRKTTHIKDIVYCLIGLLGILFSIAYHEGHVAFCRLQVEILQHSHDMGLFESLFCQSHLQPLSIPQS